MRRRFHPTLLHLALLTVTPTTLAQTQSLTELSLQELMSLEVTSAAKKSQKLSETAAAVYVLSNEEIRRSGATNIPEALRAVPGVQVAQIGSSRWSITTRGSAGQFSNKLLVLMDGRSVYTPLYAGVWWDTQDIILDDIERIEIIRGAGSALWGANAVNGIINIITKKSQHTQGGLTSVRYGDEQKAGAQLRYGDTTEGGTSWRAYGKSSNTQATLDPNGKRSNDMWISHRVGIRTDNERDSESQWMFSADAYSSNTKGQDASQLPFMIGFGNNFSQLLEGGHVLGRWHSVNEKGEETTIQSYLEHSHLQYLGTYESRTIFDIDYQNRLKPLSSTELTWGLAYRQSEDELGDTPVVMFIEPKKTIRLGSLFAQTETELLPNRLKMTLGGKLEHHSTAGTHFQPTARFVLTPNQNHTFWGAVSRSVRTPSRYENTVRAHLLDIPALTYGPQQPLPVSLYLNGAVSYSSEVVDSLDLGWRARTSAKTSIDLALYTTKYKELNSINSGTPQLAFGPNGPYLQQDAYFGNQNSARVSGIELAHHWLVTDHFRLQTSANRIWVDADKNNSGSGLAFTGSSIAFDPKYQLFIRAAVDLNERTQLDINVRHIAKLLDKSVGSYSELGMRLAWQQNRKVEWSLVGQNLLHSSHGEFVPDLQNGPGKGRPNLIPRGIYGQVKFKF
ncbi:TonB-dependent receptor plug domain-containing protein [Ampullimonas aquatilis]|uniref:TonB-dependent receptor plug domain-containing protein n=1 Tax=Ampullimonas aquatilis TaxID=1341549 RepID=UPI003C711546